MKATFAMPALGIAMLAWTLTHSLPAIYVDCVRHRGMLPVAEDARFCVDNNRIVYFVPARKGGDHEASNRSDGARRVDR